MFPPQCEFFDELEDYIFVKKLYYIGCIDMVFPQCDFFSDIHHVLFPCKSFITLAPWIKHFSSVSSLMVCHIGGIDIIFPRCEFFDEL